MEQGGKTMNHKAVTAIRDRVSVLAEFEKAYKDIRDLSVVAVASSNPDSLRKLGGISAIIKRNIGRVCDNPACHANQGSRLWQWSIYDELMAKRPALRMDVQARVARILR